MAKNFVQQGDAMSFVNTTGNPIASGDAVIVGTRVGAALVDIPDAAAGSVRLTGVFRLPKAAAVAFAQGAPVYLPANSQPVDDQATGTPAGYAFEAAAGGDPDVLVKLTG